MSYNKNIKELNEIWSDVKRTQDMIFSLLEKYEKRGLRLQDEDVFLLKELKNKFKLDYQLAMILINVNIMNYTRYIKSLDKGIDAIKKNIEHPVI